MKRISLKQIMSEVHRLDTKVSREGDEFKCAVVLLTAALVTGPNVRKVSKFCSYPRTLVQKFVTNWRLNRVWGHKYLRLSDWNDKKAGGVAFWLDVSIGLGFIRRVK